MEVCDPENLKTSGLAEQQLAEVNDEFEEDLVLMTESNKNDEGEDVSEDEGDFFNDLSEDEEETSVGQKRLMSDSEVGSDDDEDKSEKTTKKRKTSIESDFSDENSDAEAPDESEKEDRDDGTWEDIYGRLRTKEGTIVDVRLKHYFNCFSHFLFRPNLTSIFHQVPEF